MKTGGNLLNGRRSGFRALNLPNHRTGSDTAVHSCEDRLAHSTGSMPARELPRNPVRASSRRPVKRALRGDRSLNRDSRGRSRGARTTNPIAHFCQHCRMKKSRDAAAQLSSMRGRHPHPLRTLCLCAWGGSAGCVGPDFLRLVRPIGGSARRNAPAASHPIRTGSDTQESHLGGTFGGIHGSQLCTRLRAKTLWVDTNPVVSP